MSFPPRSLYEIIREAQSRNKGKQRARQDVSDSKNAADFYVPTLPGMDPNSTLILYSGLLAATTPLTTPPSDAHLFFLLVRNKHIADRQRLVIWFNGGPGCSSETGAMLEVGPLRVTKDGMVYETDVAWNEYANILFIDQPAGTGFSYVKSGSPVREQAPAAQQTVDFLQNFYTTFPQFHSMDTYLAGESFAGISIPYLATAIQQTTVIKTPLKGLIIGNGWFDPAIQYPAYRQYAYERKVVVPNTPEANILESAWAKCNATLSTTGVGQILVRECEPLIGAVIDHTKKVEDGKNTCISEYDVTLRRPCGETYPSGSKFVASYLRKPESIDAFHAQKGHAAWSSCSNKVSGEMWSYKSKPSAELIPSLVETIPLLLFSGENDFMCSGLGIKNWLDQFEWKGEKGFGVNDTAQDWYVNNQLAGTWQSSRGLTFVNVTNAGHMVPIDKPHEAHDILLRFMGVNTITASGEAATYSSCVGSQCSPILTQINPNGTTIVESNSTTIPTEEELVDLGDEVYDAKHELEFGPRRTIVLVLLILAISTAIVALCRWRIKKRRRKLRRAALRDTVEEAAYREAEEMELQDEETVFALEDDDYSEDDNDERVAK